MINIIFVTLCRQSKSLSVSQNSSTYIRKQHLARKETMKFLSYYERYLMKNISGKYFIKICGSTFLPVSPPPPPSHSHSQGISNDLQPWGKHHRILSAALYRAPRKGDLSAALYRAPQNGDLSAALYRAPQTLFTLSPLGYSKGHQVLLIQYSTIISSNEDATLTFLTSPLIPNLVFVGGGLSYFRHILDLYWVFNKLS